MCLPRCFARCSRRRDPADTRPCLPLQSTPVHSTPLIFLNRAARAQIFSAQADFFSRFLGDAEAGSAAQLAQRVLAVTFGSTAGLKPELPKPPEEKKTTAGQLAIDRKNILSRVDEAMSGWEERWWRATRVRVGTPESARGRDAVVEEMKRTVRCGWRAARTRGAQRGDGGDAGDAAQWLSARRDRHAKGHRRELATTDAPAQAGGGRTRAPESLVRRSVEAGAAAELSEKHTGAVLSTITDQQHRLRELASRFKNRPPPPPKPPSLKMSHQKSDAEEELVRVRAQLEQTITDKVMAQSELGQARKDVILAKKKKKGQARPGQARPGQARPGPGQARPGQPRPGPGPNPNPNLNQRALEAEKKAHEKTR